MARTSPFPQSTFPFVSPGGMRLIILYSVFFLILAGCSDGDGDMVAGSVDPLQPTADQTAPPASNDSGDDNAQEPTFPLIFEAENATSNGIVVNDQYDGFSGTGYVAQFDQVGDYIEFDISVPRQDFYTLRFRFLNGDRTVAVRTLLLDGVKIPGMTRFRNVYDQTGPDPGGEWASLDESLRLGAGNHTIRLAFQDDNDKGDVLVDFLQVLDETAPSMTSTRSLLMNNWTDLVAIHHSAKLDPADPSDYGPRLAALHWKGNWGVNQIDGATAYFRDETGGINFTDIHQFDSDLYFTEDGILNVDYLNYGDDVLPIAIRKEYAMVPNEPILLARYTLTNRTGEDRDFSFMELVDLNNLFQGNPFGDPGNTGGDSQTSTQALPNPPLNSSEMAVAWYPELNAWIADMSNTQGAYLVFGFFEIPGSHGAGTPEGDGLEKGSNLLSQFEDQGILENNPNLNADDIVMGMTQKTVLRPGVSRDFTVYYTVQPTFEDAVSVARRILEPGESEHWFQQTRQAWQDWLATGRSTVDSGDPGVDTAYTRNLIVLRQSQQPEFGSFVASTNPSYDYKVWPRDGTVSAMSLDAAGYYDQAEKFWMWMAEVQEEGPGNVKDQIYVNDFPSGTWYTNYSFWNLDEPIDFVQPEWDSVGQFLIGVYHHWRLLNEEDPGRANQFLQDIYPAVVDSAAWIAENVNPDAEGEFGFGRPGYSVWEEAYEYATYTQVTYASGLNAARLLAQEMGEPDRAQEWLADAVTIRDNMLDPVDSEPCGGMWDTEEGYFIRGIYPPTKTDSGECEPDLRVDASTDLLWVFGLLPVDDPKAQKHREKILAELTPPYPDYPIPEDAPVQQPTPPGVEEQFGLGISRYEGDIFYYTSQYSPGGKFESTVPMPAWPWMSSYMSMAEDWLGMEQLAFARLQWYVSVSGVEYMPTGEGVDWNTQQPLPSTMSQPDDAGYNMQIALLSFLGHFDPRLPPLEETPGEDDAPTDGGGSGAPVDGGSGTPVDNGSSGMPDSSTESGSQAE